MPRMEAEKFTGHNDFGLWRIKMKALLIQQGLADAIKSKSPVIEEGVDEKVAAKKREIWEKAHSAIVLCLGGKVLREVAKETTAMGVWAKLETLYMTKSLANRLYMKQRLYSYRFLESKPVGEQLDEFNKAIDDLENIDVKIEDEDKAILLLNALPKSYDHLKDAMLYGREKAITLDEVQCVLKAKELQKTSGNASSDQAPEALVVKKFKHKKQSKGKENQGFKPQHSNQKSGDESKETRKCHWCQKPDYLKKNCFAWKKRQAESNNDQNTANCTAELEPAHVMNVAEKQISDSWIMDSGCSFHICSHKDWFEDLTDADGTVLLGNNQVCTIKGLVIFVLKYKMDQ